MELIKVNGSSVEVNGKFWLWFYIYKSITNQKVFTMVVNDGKIGMDPNYNPGDDTNLNSQTLQEQWIDNDSALVMADEMGGSQFKAAQRLEYRYAVKKY